MTPVVQWRRSAFQTWSFTRRTASLENNQSRQRKHKLMVWCSVMARVQDQISRCHGCRFRQAPPPDRKRKTEVRFKIILNQTRMEAPPETYRTICWIDIKSSWNSQATVYFILGQIQYCYIQGVKFLCCYKDLDRWIFKKHTDFQLCALDTFQWSIMVRSGMIYFCK